MIIKIFSILNKSWLLITSNWGWGIKILLLTLAYFQPIFNLILLILFSIGVDLITGIIKSKKLKQKITSNKLQNTLLKVLVYIGILILMFAIQIEIAYNIPLANIFAGFILFIEAYSIAENFDIITNNKYKLTSIIKKIKNIFKKEV